MGRSKYVSVPLKIMWGVMWGIDAVRMENGLIFIW
jgi:hypothetical protein